MFVCCVLSGRGLCDELITRPEDSYRLSCVVACDLEISWMRKAWPNGGCWTKNKQTNFTVNTCQAASLTTSQIHGKNIQGYDTYVQIN